MIEGVIAYGIVLDARPEGPAPRGLTFLKAGDHFSHDYDYAIIIENTLRRSDTAGWHRTHLEFPSESERRHLLNAAVELGITDRQTARPGWILGIGW